MVRLSAASSNTRGSGNSRANNGKGLIAYAQQPPASRRPTHLDATPACFKQYETLSDSCVTVDTPTRSRLRMQNAPAAFSSDADFQAKYRDALEAFGKVKKACEESSATSSSSKKLFFDRDFFIGSRNNLYPEGAPNDSTILEPASIVRIEQLCGPGIPLFADTNNEASNSAFNAEQLQQRYGNAHLISALNGLKNYCSQPSSKSIITFGGPDVLRRAVVGAEPSISAYCVMFSVYGHWEWVIVDGTLPADDKGVSIFSTSPAFAASSSPSSAVPAGSGAAAAAAKSNNGSSEYWQHIVEKALMKLFGSADALDGGMAAQTASTLSGGLRQRGFDVKKQKWADFVELVRDPRRLVFATVRDDCAAANADGTGGGSSLIGGHAFTVAEARETTNTAPHRGFVRLRSAWGGAASWKGAWSNTSPLWEEQERIAQELGGKPADGSDSFWMSACDFRNLMALDTVYFVPGDATTFSFPGTYGATSESTVIFGPSLSDTLLLKCEQAAELSISVSQPDGRFAVALQGTETQRVRKQDHLIVKGLGDFPSRSWAVGVRAMLHTEGAPTKRSFARSKKALLGTMSIVGANNVIVDKVKVPAGASYVSVQPLVDEGTPYVIHVTVSTDAAHGGSKALDGVTVMQLSAGLKGFVLGKKEGVVIREEPQPKEGEELVFGTDDADAENVDLDDDEDPNEECWEDESSSPGRKRISREELRKIFDDHDLDGNKFLEKSELFSCFLTLAPTASPRQIQALIVQADVSGDGRLSFNEMARIARELLQ